MIFVQLTVLCLLINDERQTSSLLGYLLFMAASVIDGGSCLACYWDDQYKIIQRQLLIVRVMCKEESCCPIWLSTRAWLRRMKKRASDKFLESDHVCIDVDYDENDVVAIGPLSES
jgi:hypothetical protein